MGISALVGSQNRIVPFSPSAFFVRGKREKSKRTDENFQQNRPVENSECVSISECFSQDLGIDVRSVILVDQDTFPLCRVVGTMSIVPL